MKTLLVWTGGDDDALCAALAPVPGIALLRAADKAQAMKLMPHADAMVGSVIPWDASLAEALRAAPRLAWLQVLNVGYDNIEALGLPARLQLSTLGELGSAAVAEHALALLLALCRRLPEACAATRAARWDPAPLRGSIRSLRGATVALLGFGPIGRRLAVQLRALGAKPVALASHDRAEEGVEVRSLASLHAVLAEARALIVCAPLKPATAGLIDAAALAALPPGALLVNVSRGAIVDTTALCAALESGHLAGAGLDVTDPEPLPAAHPLWQLPGVLLTPHVAWAGGTAADQQERIAWVAANVRRYASGETPWCLAAFSAGPAADASTGEQTCASSH